MVSRAHLVQDQKEQEPSSMIVTNNPDREVVPRDKLGLV